VISRRTFVGSLAGSLLAAPLVAVAQALPRVAMLFPGSSQQPNELAKVFVQAMGESGYVDGQHLIFDLRYIGTRADELDRVIGELLLLKPAVIITVGTPGAWAAKKATSTIPIVMATVGDPVGQGLVASMARPGGNLTGNAILSEVVIAKRLELLHEVLPKARRIGVLRNSSNPVTAIMSNGAEIAAKQLGLTLQRFDATSTSAVDAVLDEIVRQRPEALMVDQENLFWLTRTTIAQAMLRSKIPSIHAFRESVAEGGLMSYANSTEAMFRRAAVFVVRILKGAKPTDLPIEQPTKFELVINLKTVKALSLTIPPSVLARADEMIQ